MAMPSLSATLVLLFLAWPTHAAFVVDSTLDSHDAERSRGEGIV